MISGEVMPVIGKWLNYMSRLHDGVDAILIADRHGTIEYSAMFSEQENGLADEGFIGKNILSATDRGDLQPLPGHADGGAGTQ